MGKAKLSVRAAIASTRQEPQDSWMKDLQLQTAAVASPGALLKCAALSASDKLDVLRRWYYDTAELAVAEEEGMPRRQDDGDLMREILLALQQLTVVDVEHTGASKQHGLANFRTS